MKGLALQSTSQVSPAKKPKTAPGPVVVSPYFNQPVSTIDHPMIQRKSACACGGGCPTCQEDSPQLNIQTKLAVNAPGDQYEQEADRVADQVLAMPAHPEVSGTPPRIQRHTAQANAHTGAAPASVDQVLAGSGRPLDPALRQDMEQRFGHDFSQVRVHSDAAAEQTARDMNAPAYTVGHNIAFGARRFAPRTQEGRRLIVHELTHEAPPSGSDPARFDQGNEQPGLSQQRQAACAFSSDLPRRQWNLPIQRFNTLSSPGDPLEQEADRTADTVFSRLSQRPFAAPSLQTPGMVGVIQRSCSVDCESKAEEDMPIAISPSAPNMLQRLVDPDEDAADAAANAAMAEQEVEGNDEDEENDDSGNGDEVVQAKYDGDSFAPGSPDVAGQLLRRIDETRYSGRPLEQSIRSPMESAFRTDLSSVRLHTDDNSAGLASSIHALAFTSGRDIYFAAGRYNPESAAGQRLLAHELTHVVQQRGASSPRVLQRSPDEKKSYKCTSVTLDRYSTVITFSGNDGPAKGQITHPLPPGTYKVWNDPNEAISLFIEPTAPVGDWTGVRVLFLYPPLPESGDDYTEYESEHMYEEGLRLHGYIESITSPLRLTVPDTPVKQPSPIGTKDAPETDAEGGKSPGGLPLPSEKTDDSGGALIPGEHDHGSKYGVFDQLDLPQPVIDFLEKAMEALGDAEEMQAMSATLRMLKELAEHRDELAEMFRDPSSLLEIALGLKDNAAVTAIEAWVASDIKEPKKSQDPNRKGIVALASKIVAMVGKLRKILRPVFKVRSVVQSALGGVGLLLEALPALETLLDIASDPAKLNDLNLQSAVDEFAVDFAEQFKLKLDFAPSLIRTGIEKLSESDLVTYQELARAVTAAILAAVPKAYKPAVALGKKFGLDKRIADHVVAPLIPEAALDGVNDVIKSLIRLAQPTLDAAAADVQRIIDELAPSFLEELPQEVKALIKPSRKPGHARSRGSPVAIAALIGASASGRMDEETRTEAETHMGHVFGDIRVHSDRAAGEASERLHANAFVIGTDVYFGPGKFHPRTREGRRLLYHELAHTTQQQSRGSLSLQPDYKDLLKRLAKRFSASIVAELRGATSTSSTKRQQVAEIKDKVSKLVGRKVESRTNPALPTGYMYIPKDTGKIKTIRRGLAWIRFLPALTIDKNRFIRLSATLSAFDPRNAARAALRRALGCDSSNQEAHHVIPLELYLNDVVKVATANGFKFNGADNGVCISKNIHSGSHPIYTADVLSRLNRLKIDPAVGTDWTKLEKPFKALVTTLKTELKARRKKLA